MLAFNYQEKNRALQEEHQQHVSITTDGARVGRVKMYSLVQCRARTDGGAGALNSSLLGTACWPPI